MCRRMHPDVEGGRARRFYGSSISMKFYAFKLTSLQRICEDFPESTRLGIMQIIEKSSTSTLEQEHGMQALRISEFLLTSSTYNSERHVLLDYADVDAALQWQQLQEAPEKEVKYSLINITRMIRSDQSILGAIFKDKAVERAVEDRFEKVIIEQENQNEVHFSQFWADRVISRCHIYSSGLSSIQDQKLRDQLEELFTTYVIKDLLPDSIAKARSQGLVLSRKTRKNLLKLESSLKAGRADLASILSTLDKFNKKQGLEAPDQATLESAKQAMVNDMIRRMQKQRQSDGPVLFLTLVVILFAKHYEGVVYATGKFAPKLLKQLKSVLQSEEYEQVEGWKEAAKSGTLSADDRAAMGKMAEA